jgi:hypothetical protein
MDDESKPIEIIPVVPETPEQVNRFKQAEVRREYRLKRTC